MAKRVLNLVNFFSWLTGVMVSLAIGLTMVQKSLVIFSVPVIITVIVGWMILLTTVISIILVLFKK